MAIMNETVSIEEIKIGERSRTDLGDLTDLIESIRDLGLIQPIVITTDRELIAGGRRLEACRKLGMIEVSCFVAEHITDAVDLLKAERDENTCRKDMTVSEKLAIGARIEELKRPEARERLAEGRERGRARRHGDASLVCPSSGADQSRAAKRKRKSEPAALAAEAVGMSRTAYEYVKRIKKHADDPDQPESVRQAARDALAELDATGKITPVYEAFMAKTETPAPPEAPPRTGLHGKRFPRRSLHKQLSDGLTALSGLCTAFATIDGLDDSINEEEAALWSRDLSEALRVLRSLSTKLKEHSNGNH